MTIDLQPIPDDDSTIGLKLSSLLRQQLQFAAGLNQRSIASEIVSRLEASFTGNNDRVKNFRERHSWLLNRLDWIDDKASRLHAHRLAIDTSADLPPTDNRTQRLEWLSMEQDELRQEEDFVIDQLNTLMDQYELEMVVLPADIASRQRP